MALDLASAVATHLDANVLSVLQAACCYRFLPRNLGSEAWPRRIPLRGTLPLWNSRLNDHASRLLCGCLPEVRSFIVPAHWAR